MFNDLQLGNVKITKITYLYLQLYFVRVLSMVKRIVGRHQPAPNETHENDVASVSENVRYIKIVILARKSWPGHRKKTKTYFGIEVQYIAPHFQFQCTLTITMYYPIHLILAIVSLKSFASSKSEVPMLRRASSDENSGSSRSLFEQFASFFYESMDSKDEIVPAARSAFGDRLDVLSNFTFSSDASTAIGDTKASYYYMEWFLTGSDLGCTLVAASHIKLQCSNGGRIHVDRACFIQGKDTAVCLRGDEESFDYSSDFFGAWCSGSDVTELGLTIELGGGDATCSSASGEVAHGVSLGLACGEFGSDNFLFKVEPDFCEDPSHFLSAETVEDNARCMVIAQASQDNLFVSLPAVGAMASPALPSCIYDINV